jgi:O-acetyl-ADP-ribose deacetylase (regulator of RNase III)
MEVLLTAVESDLADAWERFCGDLEPVTVVRGSILDVSCDAVVSPANSFGFMDGGIDLLYSRHFGWDLQRRLQKHIQEHHHGELLVGSAAIVETGDERIPYLIAAPTMRVPMILRDSVHPYLAARAALLLVRSSRFVEGPHEGRPVAERARRIAFPGLGTGVGQVGVHTCARQMRAAIEEVLLGRSEFPRSWVEAQARHQLLYTDHIRNLQRE